jgi:hypothetical protein
MTFFKKPDSNKRAFVLINHTTDPASYSDSEEEQQEQPVTLAAQEMLKAHEERLQATTQQCVFAERALRDVPPLNAFREIALDNTDDEDDAERFFDRALNEHSNTLSVVVGGRASGKTTKLRALVHALSGSARFISGDYFRAKLLEENGIRLSSRHAMVLIVRDPMYDEPADDAEVTLEKNLDATTNNIHATKIMFDGECASVALCVESERDVQKLARLGVRLNVLRLGSHQYRMPSIFDQDNEATFPYKRDPFISHADMLPLLCAGGVLFKTWIVMRNLSDAYYAKRHFEFAQARLANK